jgi:hypothetical protein
MAKNKSIFHSVFIHKIDWQHTIKEYKGLVSGEVIFGM